MGSRLPQVLRRHNVWLGVCVCLASVTWRPTGALAAPPPADPTGGLSKSIDALDAEALLGQLEVALGGKPATKPAPATPGEGAEPGVADPADPNRSSLEGTYRYRGREGREVFTNVIESVPLAQREGSQLDLSHVPLNSELGTQINARLTSEHQRLVRSDYCVDARQRQEEGSLWALWDRYSPIIVTGACILLFLLITPAMFRRVSVPEWVRTLRFAIPVLAVSGVLLYSMMEANRGIGGMLAGEAPCEPETWERLGERESPLAARLALVQALRAQMLAANSLPKHMQASDRGL